ncbi:MAG TPA: AAA family ATPase [Pirellulaceae bacterium]|nr:AAA family ATPase [Pirellulaceae bacterium]
MSDDRPEAADRMPDAERAASAADPWANLAEPAAYPHPVDRVERIETHISQIVLAGEFAYKIKKPVRFDFLDYSTFELRRHLCRRELEINRRSAPQLYLDVATIRSGADGATFVGSGPIIEHAVRMRRFPADAMAAIRIERDRLAPSALVPLADRLAEMHSAAAIAPRDRSEVPDRFDGGSPLSPLLEIPVFPPDERGAESTVVPARINVTFLAEAFAGTSRHESIRRLRNEVERQAVSERDRRIDRIAAGRIRECHGDLHLGNLILLDGAFVPFDAIEFNERFRWIDVAAELAFLLMDLEDRGFVAHARRVLDRYLERSGDYDLLGVLRFYLGYRALVRAKVERIRQLQQLGVAIDGRTPLPEADASTGTYLDLAESYARPSAPRLTITHGLSGSGKSTEAARWVERQGAIRLRSDATRKRLLGLAPEASSGDPSIAYSSAMTERTYDELVAVARRILADGWSVIVDATFLRRRERDRFVALATEFGLTCGIVDCQAPPDELRRRLAMRTGDASEATLEVLERQLVDHDPLADDELARRIVLPPER